MVFDLDIYYQNCRGLRSKTLDFFHSVASNSHGIYCFSETWLNMSVHSSELFDHNFQVFRRDRESTGSEKKDGGGVMIAVNNSYPATRHLDMESSAEDIWISLESESGGRVFVGCVYIPPGDASALKELFDALHRNEAKFNRHTTFLCGDFNFSSLLWCPVVNERHLDAVNVTDKNQFIIDTLVNLGFLQYNAVKNRNNRLLDLVFCNRNYIKHIEQSLTPIVKEDIHHPSLSITLSYVKFKRLACANLHHLNYRKANYDSINLKLSQLNWSEIFLDKGVDACVDLLYYYLNNIIVECVPVCRGRGHYPSYFTHETIRAIKLKNKIHKLYKQHRQQVHYLQFSSVRRRSKQLIHRDFNDYVNNIEEEIKHNSRNFWKFISNKKKTDSAIPHYLHYNGDSAHSGSDICNLFARHFGDVYVQPTKHSRLTFEKIPSPEGLISESLLLGHINSLKPNRCAGPDDIPTVLVKECKMTLLQPLLHIYILSLRTGTFPVKWKESYIVPIFKNGDRHDVRNYRPISKLCVFSKIFEKIIYDLLLTFTKDKFVSEQHGFLPGRSTETNLVQFVDGVIESMDKQLQVDAIYADFSKAFDKIDHRIIVDRLAAVGVSGFLTRWIWSYLDGRCQRVSLNGFKSESFAVTSGVPQGSHLGPLLFIIYINDIKTCFKYSQILLYADDLKIFRPVTSLSDCSLMQKDLDSLSEYCNSRSLFLNLNKCVSISFTRNLDPLRHTYTLQGLPLNNVTEVKDLGVIVDCKLSFIPHIEKLINSCNRLLGFVKRNTTNFKNPNSIISVYYAFIHSKLNYASTVWNPQYAVHSQRIESVQHRFLRYLGFKCRLPIIDHNYTPIMNKFRILSLKDRRSVSDLIFLFKVVKHVFDTPDILSKILFKVPSRLFRSNELFLIPYRRTNLGQYSPLCRMLRLFNERFSDAHVFTSSVITFRYYIKNSYIPV